MSGDVRSHLVVLRLPGIDELLDIDLVARHPGAVRVHRPARGRQPVKGRDRLGDDRLELFLPEQMWAETQVELPRRIQAFARRRSLDRDVASDLGRLSIDAVEANIVVLDEAIYSAIESEARARSLRDPADWPVVASALALAADIRTIDNDFLGTGVATWTTQSLQVWLDRS